MRTAIAAAMAGALLLAAQPLSAQGPVGIAVVEAPEQSGGVCFADNLDRGFECARRQCVDGGAEPRDCLRVAWCYPAGWSADIFVQHVEGPHWHEYLCGWESADSLEAAARIRCDREERDYLIECLVVRIWDAGGNLVEPDTETEAE